MKREIDDIDAAVLSSRDVFTADIAVQGRPVVLRGLCADWPIVAAGARSNAALSNYLQTLDSGAIAEAFIGTPDIAGGYGYGDGPDGFNFSREKMSVSEVVSRVSAAAEHGDGRSVYMGSIIADEFLPGFSTSNPLDIVPASVVPRIWLGSASKIACHYDTFDNIACVAAGRRRFTLYPPEAIADLYVGPVDHTMAGQPISMAMGSEPGDPRYPRFERLRGQAIEVELHPGDALYLPKLWWHQVEALASFNVLVNYWWDGFSAGPDAPYTTLLLAMIAIAERPERERAAWKAYFDHYVFRLEGHPLAHLPESRHGILGPLKNANYGRIRAHVMKMLRGD
jgi:hypothetical protein